MIVPGPLTSWPSRMSVLGHDDAAEYLGFLLLRLPEKPQIVLQAAMAPQTELWHCRPPQISPRLSYR